MILALQQHPSPFDDLPYPVLLHIQTFCDPCKIQSVIPFIRILQRHFQWRYCAKCGEVMSRVYWNRPNRWSLLDVHHTETDNYHVECLFRQRRHVKEQWKSSFERNCYVQYNRNAALRLGLYDMDMEGIDYWTMKVLRDFGDSMYENEDEGVEPILLVTHQKPWILKFFFPGMDIYQHKPFESTFCVMWIEQKRNVVFESLLHSLGAYTVQDFTRRFLPHLGRINVRPCTKICRDMDWPVTSQTNMQGLIRALRQKDPLFYPSLEPEEVSRYQGTLYRSNKLEGFSDFVLKSPRLCNLFLDLRVPAQVFPLFCF